MSDNQNNDITPAAVPPNNLALSTSKPVVATQHPIVIEQKSSGKGLATGALILSIIALGASGFLFVQGQNVFNQQELRLKQELDNAALGESENARKLANSLDEQAKLNQMVSQLDAGAQQNRNHIADVQRGYQELLKGRVNWLVDEVEVTLNVASQQLLLSGNVPVAITVLESIEQRLSRFEQSDLLPIKKAISADLALLKQRPYLDVSGTVLKLDSLEKGVPALPLLVDSTLQASPTQEVATPTSADFWTRTWDKTLGVLKGMVEIRKLDSNDAMLLAPEQIYFVRSNLRLRLLDARLALLQHNGEVYKNNLTAVESTVKQYFDTQSPSTQKWLDDLAALKNLDVHMVSDEALKQSQAAVRNFQNNSRTANPVNLTPVEPLASVTLNNHTAHIPPIQAASVPAITPKAASLPAVALSPVATPASAPKAQAASENTDMGIAAPVAAATTAAMAANANSASSPAKATETKERETKPKPKPAEKKSDDKKSDKKSEEKKANNAGKPETSKQADVASSALAAPIRAAAESAKAELVKPAHALHLNHIQAAAKAAPKNAPSKKAAPEIAKQAKTNKIAPNKAFRQPETQLVAQKAKKSPPAPKSPKTELSQNLERAFNPPKTQTVVREGFINPKDAVRFANVEVVQPRPILRNKIDGLETFGGKRDPVLRDLNLKKSS
ncbi:uroporphyrinogen-III C-methyltransferase [Alysiella filiformis]|uniref:HemX protein n=1 Tax=Alysiella filiformis DSM 16848 TaxID=1120981 RepID=A0A286EDE3_9NEIS|nr:uroporphyrinogen-III C-methyltransferase [Alysiella filiformis]QMT31202.1 uroporphyrinogen-III C-methyltransferase [Alysiella filiformis]UBQ55802.1 uroporphyrinogen-III C-methyltransferase [Alysiella filiformis DSM 16848]SOD68927.1 HemX protein [Alysiella filiformis DSM 16848]